MENDFGTLHIANNATTYQPVRQNNFRFFITDEKFNSLLSSDGSQTFTDGRDILDFSVVKFDVPHFSQETIEIKRGNSKVYYAGVPTWNEGSLVINDFYTADGKSILMAWQALSYNEANDTIPSSDVYKMTASVNEYLPDNTLVRSWDLEGCWVKEITEDGWDNESGNKKTVTAKIRFDRARQHANPAGSSSM